MSLLLDALKKAAKDKEQATASGGGDGEVTPEESTPVENTEETRDVETVSEPELSLDEELPAQPSVPLEQQDEEPELTLEQSEVRSETTTISDEALQMLVFKTNREHRRRQKTVWLGVTLTSVIILLVGGYYFYSEMVKDVEALERKHNIALQKVNAEVIKRKNPRLIADLTTTPVTQPPVATATTQLPNRPDKETTATRESSAATTKTVPTENRRAIEVSKSRQQDPIGELLNAGWIAYNDGDLVASRQNYSKVLQREPNNRDALLGVAAIAVANGDTETAMMHYTKLLRLDPRDPVAAPALANLQQQNSDASLAGMDESGLKKLLKHNPDASHVSFALGNIKARQQQWPQAQQYYFEAWQKNPSNADYAYNIAVSLEHLGKAQQAADFYQRSLDLAADGAHGFDKATASSRLQVLRR